MPNDGPVVSIVGRLETVLGFETLPDIETLRLNMLLNSEMVPMRAHLLTPFLVVLAERVRVLGGRCDGHTARHHAHGEAAHVLQVVGML